MNIVLFVCIYYQILVFKQHSTNTFFAIATVLDPSYRWRLFTGAQLDNIKGWIVEH